MTNSFGRLTNEEPWLARLPPAVMDSLREWIKGQAFDLTHRTWLTGGLSGSFIAVVWLKPDHGMLKQAVLKLVPPELATKESRAVGLAKQYVPHTFFQAHVVDTVATAPLGASRWWLHLQDIAYGYDSGGSSTSGVDGLTQMVPLAELIDDPNFGDYCETVLTAVSDGLNPGSNDLEPVPTEVGQFLAEDVGEDRVTAIQGLIRAFDVDDTGPEIVIPTRPDPLFNPLALGRKDAIVAPVSLFRGNGHGDLHPHNVLIPVSTEAHIDRFRLVDVGRFSRSTPLARDPMKFLLAVAAMWLPALAPRSAARSSLAELIVRPHTYPSSPPVAGYLDVSRKIHRAGGSWGARRGLQDEWERQNLLVLQSSALRFVARTDIAAEARLWFFEVAALAASALDRGGLGVMHASVETPPSALRPSNGSLDLPAGTGRASIPALLETPILSPLKSNSSPASGAAHDAVEVAASSGGLAKVKFCRSLGKSWEELADVVLIRPDERRGFEPGNEARGIWEWLEVRGRLRELRSAVIAIERTDLASILDEA